MFSIVTESQLALDGNYDRVSCLSHVGTEGFTIEETFRDQKNLRFGLGLSATRIGSTDRRDRLLLLAAVAQALLTLLGAAGEACGLDRLMKTNTSKKRTMSLLNQGINLYAAIPMMGEDRLGPLMVAYDVEVQKHAIFRTVFGIV